MTLSKESLILGALMSARRFVSLVDPKPNLASVAEIQDYLNSLQAEINELQPILAALSENGISWDEVCNYAVTMGDE